MYVCGVWSSLRFSSSPCFLLSGVCRRGRGVKSSLEACRYVVDPELFFLPFRWNARASDRECSNITTWVTSPVDDSYFVTSSRTGLRSRAELWLRRNSIAQSTRLFALLHSLPLLLPPGGPGIRIPAGSVSCARSADTRPRVVVASLA